MSFKLSAAATTALEESVTGNGMLDDLGEIVWERMGNGESEEVLIEWARGYDELWGMRGEGRQEGLDDFNFEEKVKLEIVGYRENKRRNV